MPVPFEALLPYGIMLSARLSMHINERGLTFWQLMTVSGVGLTMVKTAQNGGKWPRHNIDRWDRVRYSATCISAILTFVSAKYDFSNTPNDLNSQYLVMERDRRLTGYFRGQSDRAVAPDGFELNNPWKVSTSTTLAPSHSYKQHSWRVAFGDGLYPGLSLLIVKQLFLNHYTRIARSEHHTNQISIQPDIC
jgi:hypothetical protein